MLSLVYLHDVSYSVLCEEENETFAPFSYLLLLVTPSGR